MKSVPVVVERQYNASIAQVWSALTEVDRMKKWYFDVSDFKPVVGFEFHFTGGTDKKKFLHLCKVTEMIPGKKIAYSWHYDGYPGMSYVSFELFDQGKQTRVKVTHTGLETFPQDTGDFARENFAAGWTAILDEMLRKYVEGSATSIK